MNIAKGAMVLGGFLSVAVLTAEATNPTQPTIKENVFAAIRSIDYTSLNILLADGTDVDTVDQNGNTPLMLAARVGNPRILNIILSHNPEINKSNNAGKTALMIAAETGQLHTVKKLVKQGAASSATDKEGNSAVTLASKYGHSGIVSYLQNSQRPSLAK